MAVAFIDEQSEFLFLNPESKVFDCGSSLYDIALCVLLVPFLSLSLSFKKQNKNIFFKKKSPFVSALKVISIHSAQAK